MPLALLILEILPLVASDISALSTFLRGQMAKQQVVSLPLITVEICNSPVYSTPSNLDKIERELTSLSGACLIGYMVV